MYKTTDKYCSIVCQLLNSSNTIYKLKKKPRKSIKGLSDKELQRLKYYRFIREEFMIQPENKICPVTGLQTTEIHHKAGRIGDKLFDDSLFLAVSRKGHSWIHEHPKEAREKGWLI